MYKSDNFKQLDNETFALKINTDRDYKILQLTDLHLGFGMFSRKKDRLALRAVSRIIKRTKPDLIVLTGDSIFPFFPKAGTMNNKRQGELLISFMDRLYLAITTVRYLQSTEKTSFRIYTVQVNTVYLQREEKIYTEWAIILLILQTAKEELCCRLYFLILICMERVAGFTVALTAYIKTR